MMHELECARAVTWRNVSDWIRGKSETVEIGFGLGPILALYSTYMKYLPSLLCSSHFPEDLPYSTFAGCRDRADASLLTPSPIG